VTVPAAFHDGGDVFDEGKHVLRPAREKKRFSEQRAVFHGKNVIAGGVHRID